MKIIYFNRLKILVLLICIILLIASCAAPKQGENLQKQVHFSIDDVYLCLTELTENEDVYLSIFESDFFNKLKYLHNEYGAVFSLYIFEKYGSFDVANITDCFKKEFEYNSDWLKFGFHATDGSANWSESVSLDQIAQSYLNVQTSIFRFAGIDSFCSVLRLGYFSASSEVVDLLANMGMEGLLCADDANRQSYDLSNQENKKMRQERLLIKDVIYYPTDLRFDSGDVSRRMLKELEDETLIVAFIHEFAFHDNFRNLEQSIKWFSKNDYQYTFLQAKYY